MLLLQQCDNIVWICTLLINCISILSWFVSIAVMSIFSLNVYNINIASYSCAVTTVVELSSGRITLWSYNNNNILDLILLVFMTLLALSIIPIFPRKLDNFLFLLSQYNNCSIFQYKNWIQTFTIKKKENIQDSRTIIATILLFALFL